MSRATTWACALLIALMLSTSHLLDGPDDIASAQAVAADLTDAQRTAQAGATKSIANEAANAGATAVFVSQMASAKAVQP